MDAISADFSFTKATASERVTVVLGPGNPSSVGIGRVTVKGIGKRPLQNNVDECDLLTDVDAERSSRHQKREGEDRKE